MAPMTGKSRISYKCMISTYNTAAVHGPFQLPLSGVSANEIQPSDWGPARR